ncbi:UPF0271 protein YcsF [Pullulanibacillus camelliae]|uniref:5-oxoprolinase subunit A n=1 Tax=Pullulanibacillus camelliae TaxID=1707096 RepID=A0A8J3DY72_9BACL|nr:5-oxoprolinase subunit PxpA [Pullulanibacillus camelliae]GGE49602.1 UPF0271 protein YcsF [Pullulanibacillus camelliae]
MLSIDLNCDLGESFGAYTIGNDEAILDVITSANIACGYHAGDPHVMHETVKLAIEKGIGIGAHPSFPDLNGFGRRMMDLKPSEIYEITLYQIGALQAFVHAEGGTLQHVKPHGALYNIAEKDAERADAIAKAIHDFDSKLILFAPYQSALLKAGKKYTLRVAAEVFADRTYQPDGTLTPRKQKNAVITDITASIQQVKMMMTDQQVRSADGHYIPIEADTVCVHGDNAHALALAKQLRTELTSAGIRIRNLG